MRNGAICLLDLDHFKRINDELGHAAGDDCLRKVSEVALGAVRAGDFVGRIGGEEFLIVMPGTASGRRNDGRRAAAHWRFSCAVCAMPTVRW